MIKNDIASILQAQENNIRRIVREVIAEDVTPRLDDQSNQMDNLAIQIEATKAASETAHKEIIERLDRLELRSSD